MDTQISNNNWQNKYSDPIIQAAAKARYEELQKQLQELLLEKKDKEQEISTLQKFWNDLINRQEKIDQKINNLQNEIKKIIESNNNSNIIVEKPPLPKKSVTMPIPQIPSNSLLDQLKNAKIKEQELHNSNTATAMDIANIQQKIKDLQNQLKQ